MNLISMKPVGAMMFLGTCAMSSLASDHDSDTPLSLAHIQPYTAEFDYYLDDGVNRADRAGYWTDSLVISDGRVARSVERYSPNGQVDLARTVVADRDTLAPVRVQQRFGPDLSNVYQLEFSGPRMTQVLIGDAMTPARIAATDLSQPVVETGLQAVFALALPLAADSKLSVETYVAGAEPGVVTKTFDIVGQETVNVMGTDLVAWRIEDREARWTYWVRREKPYILKVSHPMPGGKMATSFLTRFD